MGMRVLSICGAAIVAAGVLAQPVAVAAKSREDLRVKMVDTCVFSEWKHADRRADAAKRCGCAANAAVKKLSDAEIADEPYFGDGLTSAQSRAVDDALDACK